MSSLAAATIVSKDYLAYARVLVQSFSRFNPNVPFFVLVVDNDVAGYLDPEREPFHLLQLDEINIPELPAFRFRYAKSQVTVAAKPYVLSHLLSRGFSSAVYFDADMLILADLDGLLDGVRRHAMAVTPHHVTPPTGEDRVPRELEILLAGVYNAGFVGFSDTPTSRRFLTWWQARLYEYCWREPERGLHHDQRWLDLAPAFVEDIDIVCDPGCNVAYWNLPTRRLQVDGDVVTANGAPCRFFHFSGLDPEYPTRVTKYWPDMPLTQVGPAAALYARYAKLLEDAGHLECRTWPYVYDVFDNGVTIPDIAREIYTELGGEAARFGDPIRTEPPESYYRWLISPVWDGAAPAPAVARLWHLIYERRPDLRVAFPDHLGPDRAAFLAWTASYGRGEYGIGADLG